MSLIEHIYVLWLRGNRLEAAFEVEHTTAVYSGLLRMSDLITLHPNLTRYVCESSRPARVRPTFDALEPPLHTVCGFIPYSRLFAEAEVVRRYGDQLKPGFLSGIAEYAADIDEGYRSA